MKTRWFRLGAQVLALVVAAGGAGCAQRADKAVSTQKEKGTSSPALVSVHAEQFAPRVEVSARTKAVRQAVLSFSVPGRIAAIPVQLGDRVRKGDVVAKLDPTDFKLAVRQAAAAVEGAAAAVAQLEVEVARVTKLVEGHAAPSASLDEVRTKHKAAVAQLHGAQATLAKAKKALADTVLTAPFDGLVTQIFKEVGEQAPAMPPTMILQLMDTSTLEVVGFVPENAGVPIAVGDGVDITIDSANRRVRGEVVFVSGALQPGSRAFEVRAQIDNADGSILAGAFARMGFSAPSRKAVFVPQSAVGFENDLPYVLVWTGKGLERRTVVLGAVRDDWVEVRDGLTDADRIARYPRRLGAAKEAAR